MALGLQSSVRHPLGRDQTNFGRYATGAGGVYAQGAVCSFNTSDICYEAELASVQRVGWE